VAEVTHAQRTLPFPEGAGERQGLRAGVVSRTAVMVIDTAYIVVLVGVVYLAWAAVRFLREPRAFSWPDVSFGVFVTTALTVAAVSLAIGWAGVGRTVGMRIMGLRIVDRNGDAPAFGIALMRAITCVLFPLGLFWSAVSKRNASVHDLIFRTAVIYDWKARVPGTNDAG
jgi:uncharacterized RDD family membrane protein YckC